MTEMVTQEEWVEALRSGEYKQTTGMLCRVDSKGDKSFCCLGVYMDLLEKRGLAESTIQENSAGAKYVAYKLNGSNADPESEVLPAGVDRDSFFPTGNPYIDINDEYYNNSSIAEVNDNGATFSEIADLVEGSGLRAHRQNVLENDL